MRTLLLTTLLVAASPLPAAQTADAEAAGLDLAAPGGVLTSAPGAGIRGGGDLLMIPESTNDNVLVLDATSGDLLSAAFLQDNTGLSTPINAIPDFDGSGILVCDQIADAVYRYSSSGTAEGLFAPAGGVDPAILNNVRGCTTTNDTLLVSSAGSASNVVAAFITSGASIGPFVAAGSGGLDGAFDVLVRPGDVLVPSINSNNILRYGRDGAFLGVFATDAPFTEQLTETASGTILAAEFTNDVVNEYPAAGGAPIGSYAFSGLGGFRGVYELPSGSLLVTTGSGVFEVLRDGTVVRQIVSGVSARFIERVPGGFIVASEPAGTSPAAALRVVGANPFRLETTLALTLDATQAVRVEAFDATGRRVAVLFDGVLAARTPHLVSLRASGLPAGVYAVRALGESVREVLTVTHVE